MLEKVAAACNVRDPWTDWLTRDVQKCFSSDTREKAREEDATEPGEYDTEFSSI